MSRRGGGLIVSAWREQVKTSRWTSYERVYRATALDLADVAAADGSICRRREWLADACGLPPRSFDYHLKWLVEHGWIRPLHRAVTRGSGRRPATYMLSNPGRDESQTVANEKGLFIRNQLGIENPRFIRKPFANSIDSANASELVAVQEDADGENTTAALASAPTIRRTAAAHARPARRANRCAAGRPSTSEAITVHGSHEPPAQPKDESAESDMRRRSPSRSRPRRSAPALPTSVSSSNTRSRFRDEGSDREAPRWRQRHLGIRRLSTTAPSGRPRCGSRLASVPSASSATFGDHRSCRRFEGPIRTNLSERTVK